MKQYNLFLSHSWSYSDEYDKLIGLLENKQYFDFRDYSIPKDDSVHNASNSILLYEAIKRKISLCHIVIVLAGVYATYSKWINNEIKIAKKEFSYPKPILAVVPRGQMNISTVVRSNADGIAYWNTDSIVDKIRELC